MLVRMAQHRKGSAPMKRPHWPLVVAWALLVPFGFVVLLILLVSLWWHQWRQGASTDDIDEVI
jgi:multidrug resistance efflux pump